MLGLLAVLCAAPLRPQPPDLPDPAVTFKVNVVARSTKAVNYRHRSGATEIDFRGTAILPKGEGKARIESKQGRIEISASFNKLSPAYTAGPEYLTYVLWAITPEGRAQNLGELLLNGQKSKIEATTELQVFGLIVTAEPYFAVTQPSDVIVMENEIRPDTKGRWDVIDAKYELLQRGQFAGSGSAQPPTWSPKIPIELIEARNAVRIAKLSQADKYAADIFDKASQALASAEDYHDRQAGWKSVSMMARESVQRAEDARVVALRRQQEERLDNERKQSAQREAEAKAVAAAEMKRREKAEQERAAMEKAKLDAEAAALRAQAERQELERRQKEAEMATAAALAREREAAALAERARRRQLRQHLRDQLNTAFPSTLVSQGVLVNIPERLFDGEDMLSPEARERLARVTGLLAAYPGLDLQIGQASADEHGPARQAAIREYFRSHGLSLREAPLAPPAPLELFVTGALISDTSAAAGAESAAASAKIP